jgi:adenosylcobinamide-GDP ribazoletransferase
MLGRWASVLLSASVPYARRSTEQGTRQDGNVPDFVGPLELVVATCTAAILVLSIARWRGLACWVAVLAVSGMIARLCRARIGGITGDTLGAATELSEVAVLLVAIAFQS